MRVRDDKIRTRRTLLRNDVISVVELNLSEVTKRSVGTPNNALCPCAGFKRLVDGGHEISSYLLS